MDEAWPTVFNLLLLMASLASVCQTGFAQVQSFVVAPSNESVVQGQTAVLKCQVSNKKGALQWTKDDFALGYQRSIPGYARYRMDGSEALGEYHLVIESATLEDDAPYQCQVGPTREDPPLVGRSYLTVIVPPQQPVIDGHQNGSVIRVSHQTPSLAITCSSAAGRPAARIRWLRNGVELSTSSADGSVSPGVVSIEYTKSVSAAGNGKLEDATSVLTIAPRDEDNDAYYSCLAGNDALQRAYAITVQLNVQHPPGAPEITGYTAGQVLKTGDTARLVCVSRGGNPLAQVYWYRNGDDLDFSYVTGNNRAENELVFTVQPTDNNAIYACRASNSMTSVPLETSVKLTVQFAPEKVTISGHQNAKAGDTIKLRCESANSNPRAVLTWFARGRQLTGATSKEKPSPQGGFVTTSELTVTVTERDNDVIYQCHGTNEALAQTVVDNVVLKVMYPPEAPVIEGDVDLRSVYAGSAQSLTCRSVGGNPPATLSWWKGNRELTTAVRRVTGNIVSSQVSFLVEPSDNNAVYRCAATNPATSKPLVANVTLRVSFPPKSLEISLSPKVVKVGQSVTVTCRSSSSNPPSRLSWWKNGDEVAGVIDGGTSDAEFGGWSSVSRLELTPSVEDHGEIYACRATNTLLEQAVSDAVTLNVLYKPYFPSQVPTDVVVVEKQPAVINATAIGNPSDITYSWYRGNTKLDFGPPSFRRTRGVLESLTGFKRSDSGVFTCEAQNSEGSTKHDININVHFPAEIVSVSTETITDSGSSASIDCVVAANPLDVSDLITWTRPGYDFEGRTTVASPEPGRSRLTITSAERSDSGIFECRASNGVGKQAVGRAQLTVRFAPVIDKSPVYAKAAASNGTTATLTCRADGVPAVSFSWTKEETGEELPPTGAEATRFSVGPTRQIGPTLYEGTLYVHNTTKSDYASYQCKSTNELGTDTVFVSLHGTSRPDNPYGVRFLNSTHNSITLSWNPGFSGGLAQTFQIRYSKVATSETKYVDVSPYGATMYTVTELSLGTEYEISVIAKNALGLSPDYSDSVVGKTAAVAPLIDESPNEEMPLLIIMVVCVVGVLLLALNIILIMFFIRRRRKKMEKDTSDNVSQANTVEMFNAPVLVEDKGYSAFDQRSGEDVVDDFRHPGYKTSGDLSPFFATTEPFYPASRFLDRGGQPQANQPIGEVMPYAGYWPPVGPADRSLYADNSFNRGWDTTPYRGAPNGNGGTTVNGTRLPLDQLDEDSYKEQLRRMQRSMSPASQQQLYQGYDPRLQTKHGVASPPSRSLINLSPASDLSRNYGPTPDLGYSTSSLKKPNCPATPPEIRGHLV